MSNNCVELSPTTDSPPPSSETVQPPASAAQPPAPAPDQSEGVDEQANHEQANHEQAKEVGEDQALRQALGEDDADHLMEQSLTSEPRTDQPSASASASAPAPAESQAHPSPDGFAQPPASGSPQSAPSTAPETSQPHEIHHDLRRGRISAIRGDDVFIEIMGESKYQGLAPLMQFERQPRIGSVMEFVVDQLDEDEGLMFLSREGAVSRATWQQLTRGTMVEARCISTNKGGLELEMIGGIRAFMPASQIARGHVHDLESLVGQKLNAMVQEIDRKTKKVLLSRRAHLEQERQRQREQLLEELAEGQEREGTVTKVVQFGAFVDLGGMDGLVHVTDLSWQHVKKPTDVVQAGQTVKVKVLKIDRENDKVGLGMKQIEPDPWQIALDTTHVGDTVEGKVVNIRPFGAFIELRPGVEALLPTAEMSWSHIAKPEQVVRIGDSLRLGVIAMDPDNRRMTLSLKSASDDPWIGVERKYEVGTTHPGTVRSTTQFGAFVELEPGVEGLAHISELADRRVDKVTDVVQVDNQVDVRVKTVDEDQRKIGLSLRPAESDHAQASADAQANGSISHGQGKSKGKGKNKGPAKKKNRPKDLKSGLGNIDKSTGGVGLGNLSLDDFK